MNNKKNIFLLLTIVFIFGLTFQAIRSNILLKFFNNTNIVLKDDKYLNADIPQNVTKEKYLIVFDKTEPNSLKIKDNVSKVLEYMKKDIETVELSEIKEAQLKNNSVIFTFENLDSFPFMPLLMNHVKDGGSLLLAERPLVNNSLKRFSEDLGIAQINEIDNLKGIKLVSNLLIKGKNLTIEGNIITNSSLKVVLNKNSQLLAVSEENMPLLWKTNYDKGKIVFFNGTAFSEKINRGLISGWISLGKKDFIYPIIGAKLVYIDDFPSPVPEGHNEQILKDFGVNIAQFYREIWWKDILKGAKDYNLKYTSAIIESYDSNTKYPFESKVSSNKNLLLYSRELIKNDGEVGIHGYNHQSLAPEGYIKQPLGYNPWNSILDMEQSIIEVNKYGKSALPSYEFRVYVPPSNILSPEGKTALIKAMPSLKVISSVYINNYLGDSYTQEFEIKNGICELPRLTSGYSYDSETKWSEYNGVSSLGIFSHFIHPDDVLDEERNKNKTWRELSKEYNSLLKDVNENFSWLKPATASEGYEILKAFTSIEPFVEYKEEGINVYCKNFKENSRFIIKSDSKLTASNGCKIIEIDEGTYMVIAEKPAFSIKTSR